MLNPKDATVHMRKCKGGFTAYSIQGAGGGGKSRGSQSRIPADEADSLAVRNVASALFVICSGPIVGPVSGWDPNEAFPQRWLKDIYLDKTPLLGSDGTLNFTGFTVDFRDGSVGQTPIPGFDKTGTPTSVGVTVRQATPTTRLVSNAETQAVIVRIRIPRLQEITDRVIGARVELKIYVSQKDNPVAIPVEILRIHDVIEGKSPGYDRQWELPLYGPPPWEVKVERVTPDSDNPSRLQNDLIWSDLTEIKYGAKSYEGYATLGIRIDSSQFGGSFPEIHLNFRWNLVPLPHNFDAVTGVYTGAFDGVTFYQGFSTNPVWVILKVLTDPVAGAGMSLDSIDTFDFYEHAPYVAETKNRDLGPEARWSFHGVLDQRQKAFNIADAIADSFNGSLFWDGQKVRLFVDRPREKVRIYGHSNVLAQIDDSGRQTARAFRYGYLPGAGKANHFVTTYADKRSFYEPATATYEDVEDIAKHGRITNRVTKYGCTSYAEALDFSRWKVITNKRNTRTISFSVANAGMLVRLGEIIGVNDPGFAGKRLSGRIVAVGADYIEIDDPLTLEGGDPTDFFLITYGETGEVIKTLIDISRTGVDSTTTIYLSETISQPPLLDTPWAIEIPSLKLDQYIVNEIRDNRDGTYDIVGLEYVDKFAEIEEGAEYIAPNVSLLANPLAPPPAPTDLTIEESLVVTARSAGVKAKVDVIWRYAAIGVAIDRFVVEYRQTDDPQWEYGGDSTTTSLSIPDLAPGFYEFRVIPVSALQQIRGSSASISATLQGLSAPPDNMTGLRLQLLNDFIFLNWDQATDLDVLLGGKVHLRYNAALNLDRTDPATWSNSSLIEIFPGNSEESKAIAPLDGTYLIKAYDTSDKQSLLPAMVTFTGAAAIQRNVIVTLEEFPSYTGVTENIEVDLPNRRIQLAAVDPMAPVPSGAIKREGIYYFANRIALGSPKKFRVWPERRIVSVSEALLWEDIQDIWAEVTIPWREWGAGGVIDDTREIIQARVSNDDITWSDWGRVTVTDLYGAFAEFRVILTTGNLLHNLYMFNLAMRVDLPDVIQSQNLLSNAGSLLRVNYPEPFYATPVLSLTISGSTDGVRLEISAEDETGFDMHILQNSVQIARPFSYIARGY